MKSIIHYWKFSLTIIVGISALILAFGAGQAELAQWLVSGYAILIAIILSIDMIQTLRSGNYGVDILAITAIGATIAVGQFWAALVIVLMLTGGETLEDFADRRAKRELSALLDRAPQIAHIVRGQDIIDVPVTDVQPGQTLIVKPHEIVPVDGDLLSDKATFDESSLTGESLPVNRQAGDSVLSGSLNGSSAIRIKATATAKDSQYEQIIKLVREAESDPAPFVRLADRYAAPFTLIAYGIAGTAWYLSGDPVRFAEVLVVASPCPLILAAPIAIISGMSRASKHGIIVKSGAVIEKIAAANVFALDKTGTLTHGEVAVSQILPIDSVTEKELASLAASAEAGSSHILATSLLAYTKKHRIALAPASKVREITGDGIFATVANHKMLVGKAAFLRKNKVTGLHHLSTEASQTAIHVARDGNYIGTIYFADIVRPDTKSTIQKLRKLGVATVAMLTGDKLATARDIAAEAGVDQIYADLLPADKVKVIKKLSSGKNTVVMVGDGVNDAPVLAAADIGIAMGARGSTAASESADAVIMLDRIDRVSMLRDISGRSIHIALQSVWVGILLCLVLMVIAALGNIPALVGAGLQELIDVVVIFNALRAHRGGRIRSS
ncbi:MAG: heavy metal translocating P-type ATPase [Sphaerimonospora mesophila]